jgi:ribosomal subunit interface protein
MRFDVKFKGLAHSDFLVKAVEEKFHKLQKLEIKAMLVHVTFSRQRHLKCAEVYIKGLQSPLRATAKGDHYLISLDECVQKVWRQMAREKSKVKHHKNKIKARRGVAARVSRAA